MFCGSGNEPTPMRKLTAPLQTAHQNTLLFEAEWTLCTADSCLSNGSPLSREYLARISWTRTTWTDGRKSICRTVSGPVRHQIKLLHREFPKLRAGRNRRQLLIEKFGLKEPASDERWTSSLMSFCEVACMSFMVNLNSCSMKCLEIHLLDRELRRRRDTYEGGPISI